MLAAAQRSALPPTNRFRSGAMMKKIVAAALLIFMLSPMLAGAVLLPIGWGLAIATGYFSGSSTIILPLLAATLAVGSAMSWITIGAAPGGTMLDAPISVQLDPKAPVPTPDGWTAPVAPSPMPTPPSTIAANDGGLSALPVAPTTSPNYDAWTPLTFYKEGSVSKSVIYSLSGGAYPRPAETTDGTWSFWICSRTVAPTDCRGSSKNFTLTCPPGYTLSGSNCNLSNPAVVAKPADSRCFIVRTGNTYAADPNDPDCASGMPAEWTAGPNSITWTGKGSGDGGGSVSINATTGEVTITADKQNTDATTTRTTIKGSSPVLGAAPGAGVTVKGISEETKAGVGSELGVIPGLEIPTDYNRETTQQSILGKLSSGIKLDETGTATDGSLSGKLSDFDAAHDSRSSALSGSASVTDLGLGLSITWPVASCVDPEFTIPGTGKEVIVPMCSKRSDIQAILNYVVAILAALTIFSIGAGALTKQG